MADLTYEQKLFLRDHKIPLSRVFDATGLSASAYEVVMRRLGMWVAYGVTPCRNSGHELRLRSGHCFQCAPAGISYLRRHDESGEIYVAYSAERDFVKIGSAKDSLDRIKNLNAYKYGGANDWRRFYAVSSKRAGLIEISAHQALDSYSVNESYIKGGVAVTSKEVFSCSIDVAVESIRTVLTERKQEFSVILEYSRKTIQNRSEKALRDDDTTRTIAQLVMLHGDKSPSAKQRRLEIIETYKKIYAK